MATPLPLRVFESRARVYRRVWRGSVFTGFLSPVLYLLAMGVGLGQLVDENLGVDELSYLTFLAPGLLAATAMQTGAGEGAWQVMAGIKWLKTYEATLATPVSVDGLVYGHLLWSTARVAMVSVVFAVVMAAFQVTNLGPSLLAVLPAVLVGLALAAATTAFTSRLESDQGLSSLFRFGIVPMFLFSGTFFPIEQLPDWLEWIAYLTPLYHAVELCRWLALGLDPAVSPALSVFYLLAWTAVGAFLSVTGFRKRLRI